MSTTLPIVTLKHVLFGLTGQNGQSALLSVIVEQRHALESALMEAQVMMDAKAMLLKLFNVKMQNVKLGQNGRHGHHALLPVLEDLKHVIENVWARLENAKGPIMRPRIALQVIVRLGVYGKMPPSVQSHAEVA